MVDFARGQNVSVATNEVRARGVPDSGLATANSANDVPKVHRARRQQRRLFTLAGPLHNALGVAGFAGQIAQALRNTARGLAGAGASFTDVVRLRFFLTRWSAENQQTVVAAFMAGIEQVSTELGIPRPLPPLSVIGVDYLFEPDVLVEVEAYAVLP